MLYMTINIRVLHKAYKLKDRRRRPEGGEWEPIKIPHGIWPMSQNQPETSPFQPNQDRLAIDELSAFGTGLGTVTNTQL
jgi:hypothetical protein